LKAFFPFSCASFTGLFCRISNRELKGTPFGVHLHRVSYDSISNRELKASTDLISRILAYVSLASQIEN